MQLKRNRNTDALVRGHVALYGLGSASVELMREAKQLADRQSGGVPPAPELHGGRRCI